MTSKKPPASKRANLPHASDYTKGFLKDWQRLSHSGRYDMNRLKEAMTLLIANDTNTLRTKSAGLPDGCFGRTRERRATNLNSNFWPIQALGYAKHIKIARNSCMGVTLLDALKLGKNIAPYA